jgi:Ca2+/H+ antiporter, TMEM165/GDT1 family
VDALLPPLVAAFLAEWGDRTQLLTILLVSRFQRPKAILAGIALAALCNSVISAFAGVLIGDLINFRAITLMTALALLFAGAGAFFPQKQPRLETQGAGGILFASFFAFAVLEFGDKTQFVTATLAARADSIWLTTLGATVGILLANIPAALMAERFAAVLPLKAMRLAIGGFFLMAGAFIAISALRLV